MSRKVRPHDFDRGWLGMVVKAMNHDGRYEDELAKRLSEASDTSPRTIVDYAADLVKGLGLEGQVKETLTC